MAVLKPLLFVLLWIATLTGCVAVFGDNNVVKTKEAVIMVDPVVDAEITKPGKKK